MARFIPTLDSVTTINKDGSRLFLHPHDVHGNFTLARRILALALIAIYILLPLIPINGFPAVFLDLDERRFHFFGLTLAAQDLWLCFFILTGIGFFGFFITSLLGRVWCGWTCPHTVFLEHVFRRIERWIEGPSDKRTALDQAPWTPEKIVKRLAKHILFILISGIIAHIFLSYFVSLPKLYQMIIDMPWQHLHSFLFVMIFTGIIYFNFAWFREQLCLIICPYGRLQSTLIDDNSMIIGYDKKRGEPRGKVGTENTGDCVDCTLCVQVCPTGIDIRNGLQIECIGCANCIDACNSVMSRLKRPLGLIRYDSLNGLLGKVTQIIRPRLFLYLFLMILGCVAASLSFSTFKPANLGVTRLIGAPYFISDQVVRNQFMVRIVNKSTQAHQYSIRVEAENDKITATGNENLFEVPPMQEETHPLILQLPRDTFKTPFKAKIILENSPKTFSITREIEFLGPDE